MKYPGIIGRFVSLGSFLGAHPGLWAFVFCCLIVGTVYFTHDCDVMAFVIQGDKFALGDPVGNVGYDGQFGYYMAVDPIGAPAHMDVPAYRYQRLLYPVLARVLAFGRSEWVPWTLVLVNVIAISLSTELIGRTLSSSGWPPSLALILPLWLGQIFSLRANLHEPLCFLLVIVALRCYKRRAFWSSALALSAGALTKEPALLFLIPILLVLLLQRQWSTAGRYALIVLLPYTVMQLSLYLWLGQTGFAAPGASFEWIPYYGITFAEPLEARIFLILFIAIPVTLLLVVAGWQLLKTPRSVSAWALVINCLFIVFLTRWSFEDILAVFRLATGVIVAASFFCSRYKLRWLLLTLYIIWLPPIVLMVIIPGFLL